ncbi:hypothetical protein C8J57DRAFT_1227855 [Mycena rebaudengoi]|nr:hypothetical protein C8J57DRAFT_1227855 [Mycena rebaudengoi]
MAPERPYEEDELPTAKMALVKLVQRQQTKWPRTHGKFQPSRVTIAQLKSALLDPVCAFTTNKPPVMAPYPPKSTGQSTTPASLAPLPAAPDIPQTVSPDVAVGSGSGSNIEASPPHSLVEVRVYLEDCRVLPVEKTLAALTLPVFDRNNCSLGGFRVLGREIIEKLQSSNSAIHFPFPGTIRLSFPDPEEPTWKMPFIRIAHGQSMENLKCDPEVLEIPESRRLKLFIDNIAVSSPVPKTEELSILVASAPNTIGSTSATAIEESADNATPEVKYLREELESRLGYSAFLSNRGHVLSNPDAVQQWRFAVNFTLDYNKMKTPLPLVSALPGSQMLIMQSELLINMAKCRSLLKFLTDWKQNHPIGETD